jgi:hypothetical protein
MLDTPTITPAARVAKSREDAARRHMRRIEVTVPDADAALIRQLASVLRRGGAQAQTAKTYLRGNISPSDVRTGADLVAFFARSPLAGLDLKITRERSTGRAVDLFGKS